MLYPIELWVREEGLGLVGRARENRRTKAAACSHCGSVMLAVWRRAAKRGRQAQSSRGFHRAAGPVRQTGPTWRGPRRAEQADAGGEAVNEIVLADGPSSPWAKKPASGMRAEGAGDCFGIVVGLREHPRAAAVAGEKQRHRPATRRSCSSHRPAIASARHRLLPHRGYETAPSGQGEDNRRSRWRRYWRRCR